MSILDSFNIDEAERQVTRYQRKIERLQEQIDAEKAKMRSAEKAVVAADETLQQLESRAWRVLTRGMDGSRKERVRQTEAARRSAEMRISRQEASLASLQRKVDRFEERLTEARITMAQAPAAVEEASAPTIDSPTATPDPWQALTESLDQQIALEPSPSILDSAPTKTTTNTKRANADSVSEPTPEETVAALDEVAQQSRLLMRSLQPLANASRIGVVALLWELLRQYGSLSSADKARMDETGSRLEIAALTLAERVHLVLPALSQRIRGTAAQFATAQLNAQEVVERSAEFHHAVSALPAETMFKDLKRQATNIDTDQLLRYATNNVQRARASDDPPLFELLTAVEQMRTQLHIFSAELEQIKTAYHSTA